MFTSAVAANGRNPGGSADFCLIRGELGTGCGEGKSLEHPPGHAGRETGGATESALGDFASGTCGLRCSVLIFQLGLVLFIAGIWRVVSPVTHPVRRAAAWVNDL